MKMKEVVVEGIWDTIKGYAQSGSAGAKAAQAQARGQKDLDLFVNKVFQKWNEYTASTGDTDIVSWTNRFFKTNKINYMPGANDPASQRNFLKKALQDYKTGKFQTPTKTDNSTPGAPSDVELVSDDPYVTLKMQGTLYSHPGGGTEGWVVTKTGRKVNKFMQAMLNKAHDQLVGQA